MFKHKQPQKIEATFTTKTKLQLNLGQPCMVNYKTFKANHTRFGVTFFSLQQNSKVYRKLFQVNYNRFQVKHKVVFTKT